MLELCYGSCTVVVEMDMADHGHDASSIFFLGKFLIRYIFRYLDS